ncbi:phospholipase A2-like [Solea solea]|uniref:phospholipase A2-like n=1 Tax=Solea solea TaxID=90069 RepID=UPI00272A43D1|nr:phospholipase A2-like [Solea solea]
MKTLQTLTLLAVGLSVAQGSEENALHQFRKMILCLLPNSWPILDYADYGCYCGKGGCGTPVDDLDRCCQVHDNCYGEAEKLAECNFYQYPYNTLYKYQCDKENKTLTCNSDNCKCAMFVCECDRKAAECFSRSPYNPKYKHLPEERCHC